MLFIFISISAKGMSAHIDDYYEKIVFKIITHAFRLALEGHVNVLIVIDFYPGLAQMIDRNNIMKLDETISALLLDRNTALLVLLLTL